MKKKLLLTLGSLLIGVTTFAATVTFNKVYPGTGTTYTINSSSISWTAQLTGSSFKFTSANPADVTFSGNNVAGQLTYTSGNLSYAINGLISRKVGTGSNYSAFYFAESTVLGGNTPTGKAWLLVVPASDASYTINSSASTNSAPVNSDLNAFLSSQSSNYAPVITSNGGGANAYISIAEGTKTVTQVTSTDQNTGDNKTFSITGGADAAKFTIDASGNLALITAPDYEIPTDAGLNNVYDVQVTVTDSQGATDTQNIAVTITDINDNNPDITSNGGAASATVYVVQGLTAVTTVVATDADYGDVLTYSISGGTNQALFSINPTSGALTFKSAAVVGTYVVNVRATDAAGHSDTQILTVNVTSTDLTAPTLVITSSDNLLAKNEVCTISFKFSEAVQGFTAADVSVTGGILGTITQSANDPTLYTATFTQSGTSVSSPVIAVADNTYQDLNNNNGTGNSKTLSADWTAPTVAITMTSTHISFATTQPVTFTFSENPGNSFTLSDISVDYGTISNLVQSTTDPKVWTASLTSSNAQNGPVINVIDKSYTDLAGNQGSAASLSLTLDPPSIDLANNSTDDTGISFTDNITNNQRPVITGSANTSDVTVTITVTAGGVTYTYNNVPVSNKIWSLNLATTTNSTGSLIPLLADGYVSMTLTGTNSGTTSGSFLVDRTAPAAPAVNNLTTYDQTPVLTGTTTLADGDIFAVTVNNVTYTNGDGYLSVNGTSWTLNIPIANRISPSTYTVTARTTDVAGNASTATGNLTVLASTVTIDLANTPASDTGTSSSDNITANRKPVIVGTATGSDSYVKVTVVSAGFNYTYNNVAVSSQNWSLDLSSAIPSSIVPTGSFPVDGLPSGTVQITVEGNTSGAIGTNSFTIDITAPAIPTVNTLSTTDTTPTITGAATVAADDIFKVTVNGVTYTNGDGNLSYSGGAWSLTIPNGNALPVKTYTVVATVTDKAGNTATSTSSNQLTINEVVVENQTYNITASPTFTTATISWSAGNRTARVVFLKEGAGAITNPVNSTTYTASTNWSVKGSQLGTSGYYCIYKGTGSSVKVTGLYPGRTYTVQAYEFNGTTGSENYLTSVSGVNNPATFVPWPSTTFTNSTGVSSPEAWNTSARWDHDTIPSLTLHPAVLVYIDGNCVVTGSAGSHNLTINASHNGIFPKLTVNAAAQIGISGQLTNNAGAAGLVIKSASGQPNGTLIYGSGTVMATVELYSIASWDLSREINNKYKWQFFGIPVKSITAGNTFNFSNCYLRKWDESVTEYNDLWIKRNDGTTLYQNASSVMNAGDGYELVQETPTTYTFTGELVHDDFVRTLNYSPGAYYAGQNILSNPFTAAIDISTIEFGSNTEETVYQYNTGTYKDWNDNQGGLQTGTNKGQHVAASKQTAGHNGIVAQIPSMQGFLVKCTSQSGASIRIPYVTSLAPESELRRVKEAVSNPKVSTRIDISGNNSTDKMWIFTHQDCSRKFDNGWDARKLIGSASCVQIFATETNGNYQIDGVSDMSGTMFGIMTTAETSYKLIFTHENAETVYSRIYLIDLIENKTTDITQSGSAYSFNAAPGSTITNRFKIVTERNTESGSGQGMLKVSNTSNEIIVENMSSLSGVISLYNLSGTAISSVNLNPSGATSILTSGMLPGVYVVYASTEKENIKSKIIIR